MASNLSARSNKTAPSRSMLACGILRLLPVDASKMSLNRIKLVGLSANRCEVLRKTILTIESIID